MIEGSILAVCYGGGHAAALLPVIEKLRERGENVCALALTTGRAAMARQGVEAVGIAELLDLAPSFAAARDIGARLAAGQSRHPLVSRAETEAYLGVGYLALEDRHGPEEAALIWREGGRQAFMPAAFFEEIFSRHRPELVLATNSPRFEQAALHAARGLSISSVCLVDLYAAHEIAWCGTPDYASITCVLNEEVRNRFIAAGVPGERVITTGNPAFDRLGKLDIQATRARTRAGLGIGDDDRLIVSISQPEPALHIPSGATSDPELPARIDRQLATLYRDEPGVHVLIRLHPSEDRPPVVSGPRIRYGDQSEPLDDLLCAADCVLTCSSTVGVEAALLGVPVIQIMESIFSETLPLADMGLAMAVADHRQIGPAIAVALSASAPWERARSPDDFRATDHVVAAISGLLQPRGPLNG